MKLFRAGFAMALTAVLLLPYAAPVLCTTLEPHMDGAGCGADSHLAATQPQDRCDSPGCATVPAAPITTLTLVSVAPPMDGASPIGSATAPLETQAAPLIPPPRA